LGDGDALLQDAGCGALVQLAVYESERFGHSGDAPGLRPIWCEFPSIHPGEVFGPSILLVGGWLHLHGLSLVRPVALE
jgi:hypothetical protein